MTFHFAGFHEFLLAFVALKLLQIIVSVHMSLELVELFMLNTANWADVLGQHFVEVGQNVVLNVSFLCCRI